jgi:hypothetical protein
MWLCKRCSDFRGFSVRRGRKLRAGAGGVVETANVYLHSRHWNGHDTELPIDRATSLYCASPYMELDPSWQPDRLD